MKDMLARFIIIMLLLNFISCESDNSIREEAKQNVALSIKVDYTYLNWLWLKKINTNNGSNFHAFTDFKLNSENKFQTEVCDRLRNILENYEFPNSSNVGEEISNKFMLSLKGCILSNEFEEKIIASLDEGIKNNNLNKEYYAMLIDHIRMNNKLPQKYGSFVRRVDHLTIEPVMPVLDSINLNKARAKLGLSKYPIYLEKMKEEMMQTHYIICP
jgi:hypothetical protein